MTRFLRPWIVGIAVWLLTALPLPAGNAAVPDEQPGGAETYYRWLMGCLDGVEKKLPEIIKAAEAAARIHVGGGRIGVAGDVSFVFEAFGRSGGLMSLRTIGPRAIVITGLVDANNYRGDGPAKNKAGDNILVIGFGSQIVLEITSRDYGDGSGPSVTVADKQITVELNTSGAGTRARETFPKDSPGHWDM